jgi:hypothetical protein
MPWRSLTSTGENMAVRSGNALCKEKVRLLDLYKAAVWAHSTAVHDMFVTQGKISKADNDLLWIRADQARASAETARSDLHAHTTEHGC